MSLTGGQREALAKALAMEQPNLVPPPTPEALERFIDEINSYTTIVGILTDNARPTEEKRDGAYLIACVHNLREALTRPGVCKSWGWNGCLQRSTGLLAVDLATRLERIEHLLERSMARIPNGKTELSRDAIDLVCLTAAAWHHSLGQEPTTTAEGPFETIAGLVHKFVFGTGLNRRRLLRGKAAFEKLRVQEPHLL